MDTVIAVVMLALCFITLYPMYYVIVASFSNNQALLATPGVLWYPNGFNLCAYKI